MMGGSCVGVAWVGVMSCGNGVFVFGGSVSVFVNMAVGVKIDVVIGGGACVSQSCA